MSWILGHSRSSSGRRTIPASERLLAIVLDSATVTVKDVTRYGDTLEVHASHHWTWPSDESSVSDHEARGTWLRDQLDANGVAPRPVLLVLPRQTAMLKLIDVPAVPAEEQAAAVLLQAESRLSFPLEGLCVDYVTTLTGPHALLVCVPRETLAAAQSLFHSAGLSAIAATLGELNLIHRNPSHDVGGIQLAVFAETDQAELTLSSAGTPLASMTVRFASGEESDRLQSISTTVSRLRASLPMAFNQPEVQTVALFGPVAETMIHSGAAIGCPQAVLVRPLVLKDGSATKSDWPLLDLSIQSRGHFDQSINLLDPRRPPDATIAPRRRRWRIVAAVAVVMGGIACLLFQYSRSLDQQIAELQQRDRDLVAFRERGQPLQEAAEFVGAWQQSQIDWPETLTRFVECLPPRDRAYLTQLSLDVTPDSNSPVIRVNGQAKTVPDVLQLHQRLLSADAGYDLRPHGIEPSTRDEDYPSTFDVEAAIKPDGVAATTTSANSGRE